MSPPHVATEGIVTCLCVCEYAF